MTKTAGGPVHSLTASDQRAYRPPLSASGCSADEAALWLAATMIDLFRVQDDLEARGYQFVIPWCPANSVMEVCGLDGFGPREIWPIVVTTLTFWLNIGWITNAEQRQGAAQALSRLHMMTAGGN